MVRDTVKIEKRIMELESQMERVMALSRSVIRTSGKSMTAMHVKDAGRAKDLLAQASRMVSELRSAERGMEHYSMQAHQEYAEAMILHSVLGRGKIPTASEIGEAEIPYLLGLMDSVGELKREAFESMRAGRLKEASRYYAIMLDIYDSTAHFRFANSIVPEFRRKQDVARIQLESAISELVSLEKQEQMRKGKI